MNRDNVMSVMKEKAIKYGETLGFIPVSEREWNLYLERIGGTRNYTDVLRQVYCWRGPYKSYTYRRLELKVL